MPLPYLTPFPPPPHTHTRWPSERSPEVQRLWEMWRYSQWDMSSHSVARVQVCLCVPGKRGGEGVMAGVKTCVFVRGVVTPYITA